MLWVAILSFVLAVIVVVSLSVTLARFDVQVHVAVRLDDDRLLGDEDVRDIAAK